MKVSKEDLALYKQKVFGVAKAFDEFCTKNNLRYFAIAGTAIGALRHKGIIPWDDDVDFVMPRPDYERFLELAETELPKAFEVFHARKNKDYHLTMAKMCDSNTSLLVSPRNKCMLGAFIDIFPMDGVPGNDKEERISFFNNYYKKRRVAEAINTYYKFLDPIRSLFKGRWEDLRHIFISKYYHLFHKSNNEMIECESILTENEYDKCDYVAYFATNHGPKVISPREWFESYYYAPFEDFRLRLPIGIHHYLTQVYGDYIKEPPLDKREPRHSFYYLDLHKRVSFKSALMEIK